MEASPRFELGIEVLQTFALPLGYDAALDCFNIIAEVFGFVKPFSKVFLEKILFHLKLINFCVTMVISFILYVLCELKILVGGAFYDRGCFF